VKFTSTERARLNYNLSKYTIEMIENISDILV
jgi:hypothetical protein